MNSDMSLIPITTQTPSTDFDTSAKVDPSLSTDKLKDKVKEASDPWLALANFVAAHNRVTKEVPPVGEKTNQAALNTAPFNAPDYTGFAEQSSKA
jgi:hypothetical protein